VISRDRYADVEFLGVHGILRSCFGCAETVLGHRWGSCGAAVPTLMDQQEDAWQGYSAFGRVADPDSISDYETSPASCPAAARYPPLPLGLPRVAYMNKNQYLEIFGFLT
jgi:hypothetical protein